MKRSRRPVIPDGAFVWCLFPFGDPPEARSRPGPGRHIVYCVGSRVIEGEISEYLVAYTSSGSWRGAARSLPAGVIEFGAAEAAGLNQLAFHLDLRCLARIPPSSRWFPDWDKQDVGIVAVADTALRRRIVSAAEKLAKRGSAIIDVRGIGSQPEKLLVARRRPDP